MMKTGEKRSQIKQIIVISKNGGVNGMIVFKDFDFIYRNYINYKSP